MAPVNSTLKVQQSKIGADDGDQSLARQTVRFEPEITRPRPRTGDSVFDRLLRPLSSLKLTIVLFAMAIFIIWAGTLAQKESGVWVAIGQYFRTWFAFVEFKIFCFFLAKPPNGPLASTFPEAV